MKCIVIYYSYGGNTRRVAEKIGKAIGAELAEINTVQPYTGSYDDVVNQGQREVNSGFLPELQPLNIDLSQYDTVVLGTPVWWYTFAPAMNSFLRSTDLSEKQCILLLQTADGSAIPSRTSERHAPVPVFRPGSISDSMRTSSSLQTQMS